MPPAVILSDKIPFGKGNDRAAYFHPERPGDCLKVIRPGTMEKLRAGKPLRFLLRSAARYDLLEREWKSYLAVAGREPVCMHIPTCHGIVQTDIGRALHLELICGDNGAPALGLDAEVRAHGWGDPLRAATAEFLEHARLPLWSCYEFRPVNLLAQHLPGGGRRLVHSEYMHKNRWRHAVPFLRADKKERMMATYLNPFLRDSGYFKK